MNNYESVLEQMGVSNCSISSSINSSISSTDEIYPEVWQGNWYDSRIENPVVGYWIEGYEIKVEWKDEIRYYRVRNDKIERISESKAIIVKRVLWRKLSERVKSQVILDFTPQISEEELGNLVYGKAKYAAQKYIIEDEQRWAFEHCIYNEAVTRKIAKAIGNHFTTQKLLRNYYETNKNGRSLKQEWAVDDEWFIVVTVPVSYDNQNNLVQIDIKPYAPIREERRNFGAKANFLMRKHAVPWGVACILAKIEDDTIMNNMLIIIKSYAKYATESQKAGLRAKKGSEDALKGIFGGLYQYIANYSDAKKLADYMLGYKG